MGHLDTTKKRRELTEKDRYLIEKCIKHGDTPFKIALLLDVREKTIPHGKAY